MNNKPFKFRYVNEIVGSFVLLIILLLIVSVILIGHAQEWFVPKHEIYIQFPTKGTAGLKKGADVEIMETQAGYLERIIINDDGSMEGRILITGNFMNFIRTDSEAVIKKRFAVAGDSFIDITRGTNEPLSGSKIYVPCHKDDDLTEMLQEIMQQVKDAVIPFVDKVESIMAAYEGVATNISNPQGPIQQSLLSVQRIVGDLEAGKGPVGVLLRNEEVSMQLESTVKSLQELSFELLQIGNDVKAITATVNTTTQEQLPELGRETTQTIEESRKLIEGLQRHWLLRGSMEKTVTPERLAPDEFNMHSTGVVP